MDWYYAEGGKQQGPVSEEEFRRLVGSGVVQPETLVWREGMPDWQPYHRVAGLYPPGSPATQDGAVCSQCGQGFAPHELMRHGDFWVCGNCQPRLLAQMRAEPATGRTDDGGGWVSAAALLARDYRVDAGDCLERSWEMFKNNAGSLLGGTVLVYLVLFAVNLIPYLNIILSLILTGPLMGGLWVFYLRYARGQGALVGEVFGGFGPRFGQLVLANVVTGVLAGLCLLPAAILMLIMGLDAASSVRSGGYGGLTGGWLGVFIVLLSLGIAGYVYLATCWFFTLPLVADKGMHFWSAMDLGRRVVIKHWWGTLGVVLLAGLLAGAGVLLCFVGVLLTGPVAMGMLAHHFERVFGDLGPSRD